MTDRCNNPYCAYPRSAHYLDPAHMRETYAAIEAAIAEAERLGRT